jgi:3-demethylubiquinone-9 3-methyltransferase
VGGAVRRGCAVQCGWLKDRYGVSWQIVPAIMPALLNDPDTAKAQRVMQAMMGMIKLDIAALQAAHDGTPAGRDNCAAPAGRCRRMAGSD